MLTESPTLVTPRLEKDEYTSLQSENGISIYENDVPLHLETTLDSLYGAIYSSLSYFRSITDLKKINTYVAHDHGVIKVIFLFIIENGMLRVINEGMRLQANEVLEFSRFVFARYNSISAITFHAVQISDAAISFAHQRFFCAEDFIAELPDSPATYLSSLGSATRKNLKRHMNRVERDFPSYTYQIHERENIREDHLRTIIELNRARMSLKNRISYIDEAETQGLLRLTRACGAICVATIDGRVCAGAILFHIGDSALSQVNAHDPCYDDYRLGMLCCYLAVCAFIERGARRFHFGPSKYEYKSALLGRFQPYEHIVLYRSQRHFLLNMPHALKVVVQGYRLLLSRKLLQGAESGTGIHWDMARKGLKLWRGIKQIKTSWKFYSVFKRS